MCSCIFHNPTCAQEQECFFTAHDEGCATCAHNEVAVFPTSDVEMVCNLCSRTKDVVSVQSELRTKICNLCKMCVLCNLCLKSEPLLLSSPSHTPLPSNFNTPPTPQHTEKVLNSKISSIVSRDACDEK